MTMSVISYFGYNAVYTVAQVLHEMLLGENRNEIPADRDKPIFLPWQINGLQKQEPHIDRLIAPVGTILRYIMAMFCLKTNKIGQNR